MEAATVVAMRTPFEECAHAELEYLGPGGSAQYFRCRACDAALIEHDGTLWALRPSVGA